MISRLEVKNFQALQNVSLELGRLTVVVGDSNCGKSALTRALQALAMNIRGNSFVTHGASVSSVTAVLDSASVTLEKGDGHGVYRTLTGSEELEYTKLGGEVPEEVKKLLGLGSINFAGQHDTPFLLKDSGSVVARVLGDLTNVSTVFEAVREANRRRSSVVSELKTRQSDQVETGAKVNEGKALIGRKSAILKAEEFVVQINELNNEVSELQSLLKAASYEDLAEEYVRVDIEEIENAFNDYIRLKRLTVAAVKAKEKNKTADHELSEALQIFDSVKDEFDESLKEANECPMCGQEMPK